MKQLINLSELTLSEASRLIENKEVSPVELVEECLKNIKNVNPKTNAYITVYEESVREVGAATEKMIQAGHRLGPLHGIPIALKDNIGLKDLRTTGGSKVLEDWVPTKDATVASRLKGAGGIIIGKTNLHELAWGGTSDNPHFGTVRNPWDTSRFPAGSSGGSGAAVAARTCYGALGTDTGGSVRLPSAINGIVGMRPTIGRVSNFGVIPLAWSMDTVGPMTRTVEDNAIILSVLAGYDPNDDGSSEVAGEDYTRHINKGVKGLRIGIVPDYFFKNVQKSVSQYVKSALNVFESMGATVHDIKIEHIEENITAQLIVESCEPSVYHQKMLRNQPDSYGEDVRLLLEMGEMQLATHYLQAQRYRNLLRKEFLEAYKSVDVFICPTLPFTATKIGETEVEIENGKEDMLNAIMQFTGIPSLTGFPALNVPCGFDDNGLPIGMQIIGKPFDEATLYRFGNAFQSQTAYHKKSPII